MINFKEIYNSIEKGKAFSKTSQCDQCILKEMIDYVYDIINYRKNFNISKKENDILECFKHNMINFGFSICFISVVYCIYKCNNLSLKDIQKIFSSFSDDYSRIVSCKDGNKRLTQIAIKYNKNKKIMDVE